MWKDLLSDLRRYRSFIWRYGREGSGPFALYRMERALLRLLKAVRVLVQIGLTPIAFLIRTGSGVDLPAAATVGPGLYIGHFGCIIVSGEAVIGATATSVREL